jgi:ATP-binding cassette subfamily B (MDR/TAP) protein 1
MLGSAFIVAFTQGWKLTLVTATTLPAAVIGVGITVWLDSRQEAKILAIYAKAAGLVEEALSSIRNVTALGANEKLQKKYDAHLDEAKAFGLKKGPILGVQYSAEFFMMYCAYSLSFWYGIKLLTKGEMTDGGKVVTVLFSVLIGSSSITMIAPAIGDFTKAAAAAKSVLELIAQEPHIDPISSEGLKPDSVPGHITVEGVTFAYPARPTMNVLNDVSMEFEAQKTTAIVGPSGSGKSTIVALAERWYDPARGSFELDGNDIKTLNVKWLRSQIGLVQQEPVLFNDTIYNNVVHGLYGTPMNDLPEEDKRNLVREACIEANADSFIQDLPEGYDTKVGERGGFISGGQKQRVAIARSIIKNPRILLLDEATSALDPKAEGIVQAALDKVSKTRTTVMIAHKLSTVRKADKIIVINQGTVIEQGTHAGLFRAGGAYARLVGAQNLGASGGGEGEDLEKASSDCDEPTDEIEKTHTVDASASVASALKSKDVSREFSLFKCLRIILYERRSLWALFLGGFIASVLGGGVFPAQAIIFSRAVLVFQYSGQKMVDEANFWALMFFVLALGVLLSYASIGFFLTVAAFLTTRIYRSEYFAAMLRQDISFFDIEGNSSGALTSRLSTDPQRLQDTVSSNLGLIIIVIVNLVGSCVLALAYGWKLALVAIFGCIPALFFAGFMRMRLEIQSQDRNSKMYQESARFASEAVGAIRTVSSLTLEAKVLESYGERLDFTVKKAYKHIAISMALFGLSESLDLIGTYQPTEFLLPFS